MTAYVSFVMPDMSVSGSSNRPSMRVPPLVGPLGPFVEVVGPQPVKTRTTSIPSAATRDQSLRCLSMMAPPQLDDSARAGSGDMVGQADRAGCQREPACHVLRHICVTS